MFCGKQRQVMKLRDEFIRTFGEEILKKDHDIALGLRKKEDSSVIFSKEK